MMKAYRLITRISIIVLLFIDVSCQRKEEDVATKAADAILKKYEALDWKVQNTIAIGNLIQTIGGKGYVQYYLYNGRKRAIYYYGSAFSMEPDFVEKYDQQGQETYYNLGSLKSDCQTCGDNCVYADFERGVIIKSKSANVPVMVYGDIYEKYVKLDKWAGVLGYPIKDELAIKNKEGRYSVFVNGKVYSSASIGTYGVWGLTEKLYVAAGGEEGWLGMPTRDPQYRSSGASQLTETYFQGGLIGLDTKPSGICFYFFNNKIPAEEVTRRGIKGVDTPCDYY